MSDAFSFLMPNEHSDVIIRSTAIIPPNCCISQGSRLQL